MKMKPSEHSALSGLNHAPGRRNNRSPQHTAMSKRIVHKRVRVREQRVRIVKRRHRRNRIILLTQVPVSKREGRRALRH